MRIFTGGFIKKFKGKDSLYYGLSLAILLIIGLFLRLRNLGHYSLLVSDDGVTYMAVKSIINYGYSVLPSGLPYPKELVFSYPTAWICKLFGMNELCLRVFNIPFGIGSILLIYFLGKELFNRNVGLLSAGIMTFATWNLEFNRFVRSYTLVQFLFILSTYLFFKAFVREEKINKAMIFAVFFLTVFSSFLGAILVMLFFALWLVKGRGFFKRSTLIFSVSFIGLVALWFQFYESLVADLRVRNVSEKVSFSGVMEKIPWPKFTLFSHLTANHQIIWYSLLVLYAVVCFYFIRRLIFTVKGKLTYQYLMPLCLATLILFDLPELGIFFFCAYTIVTNKRINSFKARPMADSLVILVLGILWWIFYGIFFWHGTSLSEVGSPGLLCDVVKNINLIKFPPLFYYLYLWVPFPKMSLVVIFGLIALYFMTLNNQNRARAVFVFALFVGIIIFLPLAWQHSHPRYNFPAYPIFILLYSFVALAASSLIAGLFKSSRRVNKIIKLSFLTIFLFFTLEHANPFEASHVVNVSYGEKVIEPYLMTSHRATHYFDYRDSGYYIRQHLGKDDVVITAFERFIPYIYIGKVNYNVYMPEEEVTDEKFFFNEENSPQSDPYIESGAICSVKILKKVITKFTKQKKTVWIITPNYSRLRGKQSDFVNESNGLYKGFYDFLKTYSGSLVYISKDNIIEVYRIMP